MRLGKSPMDSWSLLPKPTSRKGHVRKRGRAGKPRTRDQEGSDQSLPAAAGGVRRATGSSAAPTALSWRRALRWSPRTVLSEGSGLCCVLPRQRLPSCLHPIPLTFATAAVITRVKGRFYSSHGRANALTEHSSGTVLSGWSREEGICPQPAGWDSRLTSLPGAGSPGLVRAAPLLPQGGDAALSSCGSPGFGQRAGTGGTRKVTITLFLLVFFLTTFLFLFIYFVISLLLSIFLVLLGKTKHHLENALGKGEGGRDVQQKHASPPFLPKAQHQPTGAPGARLASCLPPHDTGSPGMKDQVCSNSRLQL